MPEREPRVVQALPVPCKKDGTAVISVWSDGVKTCSNYEMETWGPFATGISLCNVCPARGPRASANHEFR